MRRLDSRAGESLEQYLMQSLMAVREAGSSATLEFEGVLFVISPAMSVSQAAAAWKSARRLHDMRSA